MITLETAYISILTRVIEFFHSGLDNVDPRQINKAKFYTRALFTACIYVANKTAKENPTINDVNLYLKEKFGSNNLFSYLIETSDKRIIEIFNAQSIPSSSKSIGVLYENLLNVETAGLEITTGKEFRNKLGSYYTPNDYAYAITEITLKTFIKQNGLASIRKATFVDFSCGCGIFLISTLSYLKKLGLTDAELIELIHHIYACDVDPIALEIAKISVLDFCGADTCYDAISSNFHHANFLMHTEHESSQVEKLRVAMEGFIYHQTLAIGVSFLQQYDVILGNPPWEKIRFEEKKFFSQYTKQIGFINFKFELSDSIEEAQHCNQYIKDYSTDYKAQLEIAKQQIKTSQFFKDSTNGELNTCTLFSDAAYKLLSENGCVGLFVKSSLVTAKVNSKLFAKILPRIVAVYDFINRNKIFEIDSRERFAIVIMGKRNTSEIHLGMNLLTIEDIPSQCELVSTDVFEKLNPDTKMIPNLSSGKDLKLLSGLYKNFPVFSKLYPDAKYGRLVHLTNHIKDIDKRLQTDNIPVFEGKFFSLFDNAYSGFNNVPESERYKSKASSKKISDIDKEKGIKPQCRFFVKKDKWESLSKGFDSDYMVAWHSLTSATNVRTCVATLLPFIPGAQSVQFLTCKQYDDMIYIAGIFNSIVFDYILKCKLTGIDLTQAVINQMPFPSKDVAMKKHIVYQGIELSIWMMIKSLVYRFYENDNTVVGLFTQKGNNELSYENRSSLFILLDATVAQLYGIKRKDLEYILSLFGGFYSNQDCQKVLTAYDSFSH